jgi:putative ABC transport system permease protein
MLAVALKGIASRKLRAISTTLAVLLGVALVAGTYVLTDTINRSFDDIFDTALKGTDVIVTPKEIVSQETSEPPAFDASLLERVERIPGVEKAEGGIFSLGRITDAKGKPFGQGFAPQFISSSMEKPFDTLTYVEGRAPRRANEAAIDSSTADRQGVELGDKIGVVGERPLERFTVVGTNKLGDTSTGGSASVTLTLPAAQRITDKVDRLDQVSIAAAPGISPGDLQRRVARVVPATTQVETGQQNAQRETDEIGSDLGFLKIALLVFAGISLVVGGFQIFNTFSITVAQRIREFGLLRTLGASRGQILGSVLLEASVIGLVGSVLGLLAGIGIASGLNALFKSFGIDLPNTGLVLESRTVIVSLVLGLGITLASAVAPALRATRVTPMAALLEAALPESRRRGRITAVFAGLLGVGGLAMLLIGLFGDLESSSSAASLMGAGSAAILFSASLYSPKLVRPLASIAGWPLERLRGLTGRLARENAMRKPGRTAVTSAALMIGLALVVFVTVFAAGLNRYRHQLRGRHHDSEHRRLLADPPEHRARGQPHRGCRRGRLDPLQLRQGAGAEGSAADCRRRSGEHRRRLQLRLHAGIADDGCPDVRRSGRDRRGVCQVEEPRCRRRPAGADADRTACRLRDRRRDQGPHRLPRQLRGHAGRDGA